MDSVDGCPLCQAARISRRFSENEYCWVALCSTCGVPMVVWRWHGVDASDPDDITVAAMLFHLRVWADKHLGKGDWEVDFRRRRVPDHWHAHARMRR